MKLIGCTKMVPWDGGGNACPYVVESRDPTLGEVSCLTADPIPRGGVLRIPSHPGSWPSHGPKLIAMTPAPCSTVSLQAFAFPTFLGRLPTAGEELAVKSTPSFGGEVPSHFLSNLTLSSLLLWCSLSLFLYLSIHPAIQLLHQDPGPILGHRKWQVSLLVLGNPPSCGNIVTLSTAAHLRVVRPECKAQACFLLQVTSKASGHRCPIDIFNTNV